MATREPPDPDSVTDAFTSATPPARLGRAGEATRRITHAVRRGRTDPSAPAPTTRLPGSRTSRPSGTSEATGPVRRTADALADRLARIVTHQAGAHDYAIPLELLRRYRIRDCIGSGGEAVVYLARPHRSAPGGEVALKLYRPGHDINRTLLDRLRADPAPSRYVPAIHDYGHARSSWGEELAWEAQEYFGAGSLRGPLDRAPLAENRARDIVAAIAECLRYWQETLQHNHTDVKPENLLFRTVDPPVLALTDFGGAARATMSRVYGELAATEEYAAPEVIEGRREAPTAWWSLGIIVHELRTGHRPPRGEGRLTTRHREVDVSAIADERWRLLARGLLSPDPAARWGHGEVIRWLAGERPDVATARRHAPVRFADLAHDDPPSLALDLMERSDKGEVWLRAHWPVVRTWLDREVKDHTFDRGYLTRLQEHPERAHLAISALAAGFVPGMPPRYRGHDVSAEGILELATGESSGHGVLREALELGALGFAARHRCDHPACRSAGTGRCARLERVQHEAPLILGRVERAVERLTVTGEAAQPYAYEWDAAWARAVELLLNAEAPRRYRRALRARVWRPTRYGAAGHAPWWREQYRTGLRGAEGEIATNAGLVAATLLAPSADRAGALARQRRHDSARLRWRGRWERARRALPTRPPSGAAAGESVTEPPRPVDARPLTARRQRREQRRERLRRARVDRSVRRIERAMAAGRCRRFARPLASLGLLDGLGALLFHTVGLYSSNAAIIRLEALVSALTSNTLVATLAAAAGGAVGTLPGGLSWWFPVALSGLLWLSGRTAADRRRRARTRLLAYWSAVGGAALMVARLLASGLLYVAMGALIPLSMLTG